MIQDHDFARVFAMPDGGAPGDPGPSSDDGRPDTSGRGILTNDEWREIADRLRLSDRELQIVQEVFEDAKEFAIAEALGISPHTVHTHLERLYHKLEVRSRCELVVRIFAEYRRVADRGGATS